MNISIFAAIGSQNIGDELIVKNEIELLRQEFGEDSQFQVASYDPKNPVFQIEHTQYFEYFPLWLKNPKNFFRNMRNFFYFLRVILWSDIVVIWGGGIIYDSELQNVWNPLRQWIFRVKIAQIFRKKIYFYAGGIDIKQEENMLLLKKIFSPMWKISVRDEKSQKLLKTIGIESLWVNDPVMSESDGTWKIMMHLDSRTFSSQSLEGIDFKGKIIWMALRQGYIWTRGESKQEIEAISELCDFIEEKGGKILFLPHSIHPSDSIANDLQFMQQFLKPGREIVSSLDGVYSHYIEKKIDMMISMRLHSIVLSYVYDIPQIVLSYSQKTDEFLKKVSK